jgi:Tol biopolymer transport system component
VLERTAATDSWINYRGGDGSPEIRLICIMFPAVMLTRQLRLLHLLLGSSAVIVLLGGCTGHQSSEAHPSSTKASSSSGVESPQPGEVLPGHVVFDRCRDGDVSNIYLYSAGRETQVTEPGGHAGYAVSPNHRLILVGPSDDTTPLTGGTIDLTGQNFQRLTLHDPTLNLIPQAWSPSGSRIAFEGWDDTDPSRTGVYTARYPDGGDLRRITTRPGPRHDVPLDYSPDGRRLVFYRSAHGDPDPHVGGSLWTIGVDGSDGQRVNGSAHPADWARWSPDGQTILFATERTAAKGALWTVTPTGSHLTRIFDGSRGFPITPTWSPDGSQILFALDPTNDEFTHPDNALVVVQSDGSQLRQVISSQDCKRWPEWWQ